MSSCAMRSARIRCAKSASPDASRKCRKNRHFSRIRRDGHSRKNGTNRQRSPTLGTELPTLFTTLFAARSRAARGFFTECHPMKLTTAIARNLELPSGKTDHIVWDEDFPGFGVRLRAGRNRVSRMWIYQFDIAGRTRRITIGNVNAIGMEDARKIAGKLQSKVRLGDDPMLEKAKKLERAAHSFVNVLKSFLE